MKSARILSVCLFVLPWALGPGAAAVGATLPLQAKHAKATLSCYNCHQEENPTTGAGVTDGSCMACHGDFAEMAVVTKALPVNPHTQPPAPHPGPAACKECHKQHQTPVVKCLECHPKFKFTAK